MQRIGGNADTQPPGSSKFTQQCANRAVFLRNRTSDDLQENCLHISDLENDTTEGYRNPRCPHFLQTGAGEPRPEGVGGAAPRGGASRRPTKGREDGGDGTSPADCEAITIVGAGQPAVPPTSGTPKAGGTGLGRTFSGVRGKPRPIAP